MCFVKIKPLDFLTFKDGKPFIIGQGFLRKTIFPPTQRTIYGMLRAKILNSLDVNVEEYVTGKRKDIEEIIGSPDWDGESENGSPCFEIGPLFFLKDDEIYLPSPMHIFVRKESGKIKECALANPLVKQNEFMSDLNSLFPAGVVKSSRMSSDKIPPLIRIKDLIKSLEFNSNSINDDSFLAFFEKPEEDNKNFLAFKSRRYGIAMDFSLRKVREHHFYLMETVEFDEATIGFEIKFKNGKKNEMMELLKGNAKLGGEGRPVTIKIDENFNKHKIEPLKTNITTNKLLYYLASPAIYEKGSFYPDFLELSHNGKTIEGKIPDSSKNVKIRLVSAIVNRAIPVGGWNLSEYIKSLIKEKKDDYKSPFYGRPIEWAVPAGSVYFFEIIEGNFNDAYELLNCKSFSKYKKMGLGFGMAGIWKEI